jgi:hypothetical protein
MFLRPFFDDLVGGFCFPCSLKLQLRKFGIKSNRPIYRIPTSVVEVPMINQQTQKRTLLTSSD